MTTPSNAPKQHRGFAAMSPEKRAAIASAGGKRAHQLGKGHRWTSEEAAEAGKRGGAAMHALRRQAIETAQTITSETAAPSAKPRRRPQGDGTSKT